MVLTSPRLIKTKTEKKYFETCSSSSFDESVLKSSTVKVAHHSLKLLLFIITLFIFFYRLQKITMEDNNMMMRMLMMMLMAVFFVCRVSSAPCGPPRARQTAVSPRWSTSAARMTSPTRHAASCSGPNSVTGSEPTAPASRCAARAAVPEVGASIRVVFSSSLTYVPPYLSLPPLLHLLSSS